MDELHLFTGGKTAEQDLSRPLDTAERDCPAERLPPELLAAAFAFLSRDCRITASHVSRYWRAAALGSPQLWARIAMTCRTASEVDFATTLMSRAGSIADVAIVSYYPPRWVDFRVFLPSEDEGEPSQELDSGEDEENDFDTIVLPYRHKIRCLWWSSNVPVLSLSRAAPFMERLHVTNELVLQSDFLAGGSGTLRTLRFGIAQLPSKCAALSSVTTLRVDDLKFDPVIGVRSLFELFPRLETLFVGGLRHENSHLLIAGPPPPSLRALTLKSMDPQWDLTRHFADLLTPDLRMFSIDITTSDRTVLNASLEPFLRGSTGLNIREPLMGEGSWFVATFPGAREHSIALSQRCVPGLSLELVALGAKRLPSVRTLDITIDLLEHFIAVVNAISTLETVTIHLETLADSLFGSRRHRNAEIVGWYALVYLQPVLDAAPQLRALVLTTHCSWTAPGAKIDARDADCILSHLSFLGQRAAPVPAITVLGFTEEIVRGLDIGGLPVRFDTNVYAEEPSYWPFQVAYDDH